MEEKSAEKAAVCKCPYCDAEATFISEMSTHCEPCSITIITCAHCGGYAREGTEKCPECGEPLR